MAAIEAYSAYQEHRRLLPRQKKGMSARSDLRRIMSQRDGRIFRLGRLASLEALRTSAGNRQSETAALK